MRSTQARPDCSYRPTQAGSGFGIRKFTEIAEHHNLAIVIGERSHCGLHAPGEFSADHLRGQRIRFGNEFARQCRKGGIFWERLVGPLAARDSPHKIARDAVRPLFRLAQEYSVRSLRSSFSSSEFLLEPSAQRAQ